MPAQNDALHQAILDAALSRNQALACAYIIEHPSRHLIAPLPQLALALVLG